MIPINQNGILMNTNFIRSRCLLDPIMSIKQLKVWFPLTKMWFWWAQIWLVIGLTIDMCPELQFHQTKMPAWSNNEHQPSCFGAELRLSWEVKSDLKIPMNENPYEWENLCNLYLPRRQRKLIPSDPPPPSNASMGKLETPSNAMHGYTRHPLRDLKISVNLTRQQQKSEPPLKQCMGKPAAPIRLKLS